MTIDDSAFSDADKEWARLKAAQMGVSPVIPEEHRDIVLARSALLLADIRHHKRQLGLPVPDEGTVFA